MDYRSQIKNYERELHINKGLIEQEYWHIGSNSWETPSIAKLLSDGTQYAEIIQRCRELAEQKKSLGQSLNEFKNLDEQLDDRQRSIESREKDRSSLETALQAMFEAAGSQIFDLYTRAPQQYIHYNANFPLLDKLFRERFTLESKIADTGSASAHFVERIVNQGKKQFMQGKLKRIEHRTKELFRKTAAEITEEWLSRSGDDTKLASILSPIIDQHEKIAEVNKIITRHKKEIQELHAKHRELSEDQNPESHRKYLQMRMSEVEEEMRGHLTKSGKILAHDLKKAPPEKLRVFFASLEKLLDESRQKEEHIQRLHAAQKVLSLKEEQSQIHQKEAKIQRHIDSLQEQLKKLNDTAKNLDSKIESQEKLRGDEQDLIQSS